MFLKELLFYLVISTEPTSASTAVYLPASIGVDFTVQEVIRRPLQAAGRSDLAGARWLTC